jgi:hypothetical protein
MEHCRDFVLRPRSWNSLVSQLARRYPSRLCLPCRFPQTLHSLTRDVFYVADPLSAIRALAFQLLSLSPNIAGGAPALQFMATIKYHKRLMIPDATRETWVYLGVKIQSHAKEFPLFLSGSHST